MSAPDPKTEALECPKFRGFVPFMLRYHIFAGCFMSALMRYLRDVTWYQVCLSRQSRDRMLRVLDAATWLQPQHHRHVWVVHPLQPQCCRANTSVTLNCSSLKWASASV